jgi:hypothetical protein
MLTDRAGTWQVTAELADRLNRALRGWSNNFNVATVARPYRSLDRLHYCAVAPVVSARVRSALGFGAIAITAARGDVAVAHAAFSIAARSAVVVR